MIKKIAVTLLILTAGVVFWFAFAIWTGLYSVYSIPPSKVNPDGATLIISREEGEPMFNSPQRRIPEKKHEKTGGIGFGGSDRPRRAIDKRTVVELPYIDWAYQKSLEPPPAE